MPRRLDRLVRPIAPGLRFHRTRSQLHGVPCAPSPTESFDLNLILPPSTVVQTISFANHRALTHFLHSCNGTLYSIGSNGKIKIEAPDLKTLSLSQTYRVFSPFSVPMQSIQHYEQNFDSGFEAKCRKALMAYMKNEGMIFNELARVFKVNDETIAEWEGVFEVDGGQHVYFLKCKHKMVAGTLVNTRMRVAKTLQVLKKPPGIGKSFLAGEYWEGGEETQSAALALGYGILYENGNDLAVQVSE